MPKTAESQIQVRAVGNRTKVLDIAIPHSMLFLGDEGRRAHVVATPGQALGILAGLLDGLKVVADALQLEGDTLADAYGPMLQTEAQGR